MEARDGWNTDGAIGTHALQEDQSVSDRALRHTEEDVAVTSPADNPTLSWRRVLVWSAFALSAALAAGTLAVGTLMPPIVVLAILFLIGGLWCRRSPKAGPILVAMLSLVLLSLNAGLMLEAATIPASPIDFLLATVTTVLAIAALFAAVGTVRHRNTFARAPRTVALATAVLVALLAGVAVAGRITYDEPVAASGDVALSTQDMKFVPETLSAHSGEITLFVKNRDNTFHTLTIDELGVDLQIPANAEAKVSFSATPGAYEVVCVPHHGMGMTGTLEVR
jgi:plastocyanin